MPSATATKIPPIAAVTVKPVTTQTTVIPASQPASGGFPLPTLAIAGGVVIVPVAGGFMIRRWGIRKQNTALFRELD